MHEHMTVHVFASGSGGNCLLLTCAGTRILIDAGISMRRVLNALAELDLNAEDIGGVLITHEHSDHVSGLKMLCKHHNVPIYAPHTVANRLMGKIPETENCMHIIPVEQDFYIGNLKIRPFHTPHDTDESVGYRVEGSGVFAISTDMGMVTDEIMDGLLGAETVLIEANHDEKMLLDGPYPAALKRRILSDHGHLSNESCGRLAKFLAENGTKNIILGHLSKENNNPELAEATVRSYLKGAAQLYMAPVLGDLRIEISENSKMSRAI